MPDRLGVYRLRQVTAPAGTPAATFRRLELGVVSKITDGDLMQITPADSGDWTPAKEVSVRYAKNWQALSASDVADAVSESDRAFLTAEWRTTAPATSSSVATKYGDAQSLTFDCLLDSSSDAAAIRDIFLNLFGTQRREYQATVSFNTTLATVLDLGAVVELFHPLLGMSSGKKLNIHGIRIRDKAHLAELSLWG